MIAAVLAEFTSITYEYTLDGPGGYQNVFVTFASQGHTIAERGKLLMDLEQMLIDKVNTNIRVWHVPIGDKNSLRKLRGVSLK